MTAYIRRKRAVLFSELLVLFFGGGWFWYWQNCRFENVNPPATSFHEPKVPDSIGLPIESKNIKIPNCDMMPKSFSLPLVPLPVPTLSNSPHHFPVWLMFYYLLLFLYYLYYFFPGLPPFLSVIHTLVSEFPWRVSYFPQNRILLFRKADFPPRHSQRNSIYCCPGWLGANIRVLPSH